MKSVDVFFGVDGADDEVGPDMRRKRKLDEDAMNLGVGVELGDQGQQLGFGGGNRKPQGFALHAQLHRGLFLASRIADAGGVFTHQNHCEARTDTLGSRAQPREMPELPSVPDDKTFPLMTVAGM